jgi:hypothetical protein
MSVSSSTEIKFDTLSDNFASRALELLIESGWLINSYTDVGDIDDFEHIYVAGKEDYEKVKQVVQQKESKGEVALVEFFTFDEAKKITGAFFFYSKDKSIYIGWNNGEKKVLNGVQRYNTDYSWYTEKLLVPFQNTNFNVIHIQHQDTDLF